MRTGSWRPAKDAGVRAIDHLITTHYHGDHFGAMSELAGRIPIREFIDHGPNVQPNPATDAFLHDVYPAPTRAGSKHTVVKPGDAWRCEASTSGSSRRPATRSRRVPGAGQPNPLCAAISRRTRIPSENAQSVGSHFTFGRFRALHLGDLTWNKEFELMCPSNLLGTVDLFVVTHHGQPVSNAPVLVHAIAPRVAVMNNGTRKGGQPDAMKVLFSSPGLEDLWQLHFSLLSGQEYTVPGRVHRERDRRAAVGDADRADCRSRARPRRTAAAGAQRPAFWIKVSAQRDDGRSRSRTRERFAKTYAAATRR